MPHGHCWVLLILTVMVLNLSPSSVEGIDCFVCNATRTQTSSRLTDICLNPAKDDLKTVDCGSISSPPVGGTWVCAKKHWAFNYTLKGVNYKEDRLERGCSVAFPASEGSCRVPDSVDALKIVKTIIDSDPRYQGYTSLKVLKVSECQCSNNMCNNWPFYESNSGTAVLLNRVVAQLLVLLRLLFVRALLLSVY